MAPRSQPPARDAAGDDWGPEATRIVLADPHVVVRRGLRALLEGWPSRRFRIVHESSSGEDVLRFLRASPADLLITELVLHGLHGLELIRAVGEQQPALRTIVLSGSSEHHYGVRSIALGALAYLSKSCTGEELVEAIEAARLSRRYLTRLVEGAIVAQLGRPLDPQPHEGLSNRELQVFQLVIRGVRSREIARRLRIAPSTVSTHLKHIQAKLHVTSVGELMRYALEHRLL